MTKPWPARLVTFFLWALAALSASYWFTKLTGTSGMSATAPALTGDAPSVQQNDLARVFGPGNPAVANAPAAPGVAAPDPAARLRLLGVVANRAHSGVALISVDGQPPRPYRVGSALDGGWTLQQVGIRSATLAPTASGAASLTLELAPLAGAADSAGGKLPPSVPLLRSGAFGLAPTPTPTPTPTPAALPTAQAQARNPLPTANDGENATATKD
ncbi:MAG: type II secretion system protein N [Burkholderiaceae bacterium]